MRTQDEIVTRLRATADQDVFGFRAEILVFALDYEHALQFIRPEVTAEQFQASVTQAAEGKPLGRQAIDYLEFAWAKARGHRGISANGSVEKLQEYAWLLGRDDVVQAMEQAPYPMYGVPQLVAFAQRMDLQVPDDETLARMTQGKPCRWDCAEGCFS